MRRERRIVLAADRLLLCRVSDAGPSLARPQVLGLALESLQGKNPRDVWLRTRSKRYGDFGAAVVMGKPRRPPLREDVRQLLGVIMSAEERRRRR